MHDAASALLSLAQLSSQRVRNAGGILFGGQAAPTAPVPHHLDADRFWRAPPGLAHTPAFWMDPEPDASAVISADRIRAYHTLVGGIVHPFDDARVRTAGYELSLGPLFVRDGSVGRLTQQDPYLVIEPNSIVFVSVAEALTLPHWLAGQFDLKLKHIYSGVLLGTGPHVDPGFQGALSCPLHNISDQALRLKLGQPFLKIAFIRATGARSVAPHLLADGHDAPNPVEGYNGHSLELWHENWREPIVFQPRSLGVSSSVAGLARRLRNLQIAAVAALAGVAIGLLAVPMIYVDGRVDSEREAVTARQDRFERSLQRDVGPPDQDPSLAEQAAELRSEVRALKRRLGQLERRRTTREPG